MNKLILFKKNYFTSLLLATLIITAFFIGFGGITAAGSDNNRTIDVFVVFSETPGASEKALVRSFGGEIKHSYTLIPAVAISIPEKAREALLRNPNILKIENDGEVEAHVFVTELSNTWGVERVGAGEAHMKEHFGESVKVAVIDSGIDYNHPEFSGIYVGGYDFVNADNDPMDDNGHGTHVAGTVAAARDGVGVVGVAPKVELYSLKVLDANGSGSWSDVIAALEWALENGIQVTNNSYGSGSDPGSAVRAAFDNSASAGILHIASAGNAGNPAGKGDNVGYPAKYSSVVAVAATDQNDKRARWSSTGPDVELSAPGVSINSTLAGGGYGTMSGTSMASPHVAGVAALVMATGVTDASIVRQTLIDTADDLGNLDQYGYGLINAPRALGVDTKEEPPADEPGEPGDEPIFGTTTVSSIEYFTRGNNRHMDIAVFVVDGDGKGVVDASVSIELYRDGTLTASATATTDGGGVANFTFNNYSSGCYNTEVVNVLAGGFNWDGGTPDNLFCK